MTDQTADDSRRVSAAESPIDTTTATFRADVLEASLRQPVLVDFWAPWCGPCRQLAPVLERLVKTAAGKIKLVKMNIDEHPEIPEQLGVKSIPAVIVFQRGRPVDGFMGALPESQVRGFLERLVGPLEDSSDDFLEAERLLGEGNAAEAEAMLAELARGDSPNAKAVAELARLYIDANRLDEARALFESLPQSSMKDPLIAAAAAALDNASQAVGVGEIDDLRRRVGFDPNDMQARFDLALALNAAARREEAADALLDIIRRDRSWSDDAARKQLVQFFEAWGPMDKATIATRRRLSSLLFS